MRNDDARRTNASDNNWKKSMFTKSERLFKPTIKINLRASMCVHIVIVLSTYIIVHFPLKTNHERISLEFYIIFEYVSGIQAKVGGSRMVKFAW